MPGLHIRELSEETLRALQRRAQAHHRSMQGEIHAILEDAARSAPPEEGYAPLTLHHVEVGGAQPWTREELYGDDER